MKIDFLCNDGSPLKVLFEDIYTCGVGGAELSLLSLAKEFADRGFKVRIYNNPRVIGPNHGIEFVNISRFDPKENRDVLIVFRSPNIRAQAAIAGRKIWWSTDQFTRGDFAAFLAHVDFCVTISQFHTEYHKATYGFPDEKVGHIDLGVRDDYGTEVAKIKNRLIFCSVPDRGLNQMWVAWKAIKKMLPEASLVITSDYTLWGSPGPRNEAHKRRWENEEEVLFVGNVPRLELVRLQQSAEIHSYPCTYDELFCISVAETQVAGTFPVTSKAGAIATTNRFGALIDGNPKTQKFLKPFALDIVSLLTTRREFLEEQSANMAINAKTMFSWKTIADKWIKLFEKGNLNE